MIDWLVSGAAAGCLLVLVAAQAHHRRARRSAQLIQRLYSESETAQPPARGPLLDGLAERVASTALGARLKSHAAASHPSVLFSDYVALALASALAAVLAAWMLTARMHVVVLAGLAAPVVVDRVAARLHGSRSARIVNQLPGALGLQAGALRAGQSLPKSLRIVADETNSPLGDDLQQMLREVDLGRPLDRALEELSARIGSRDLDLWVTSMLVHRQTGGNLAQVIDALAQQVAQRIRLRREIKAMTAQGRLSGIVVALAPLVFFVVLSAGSREEMEFLYTTPVGWALLGTGLALNGAGFWWIRWALRVRP
ncbi:MAG: type II secretion system F family protein [Actinomycetota bacterium]